MSISPPVHSQQTAKKRGEPEISEILQQTILLGRVSENISNDFTAFFLFKPDTFSNINYILNSTV